MGKAHCDHSWKVTCVPWLLPHLIPTTSQTVTIQEVLGPTWLCASTRNTATTGFDTMWTIPFCPFADSSTPFKKAQSLRTKTEIRETPGEKITSLSHHGRFEKILKSGEKKRKKSHACHHRPSFWRSVGAIWSALICTSCPCPRSAKKKKKHSLQNESQGLNLTYKSTGPRGLQLRIFIGTEFFFYKTGVKMNNVKIYPLAWRFTRHFDDRGTVHTRKIIRLKDNIWAWFFKTQ